MMYVKASQKNIFKINKYTLYIIHKMVNYLIRNSNYNILDLIIEILIAMTWNLAIIVGLGL